MSTFAPDETNQIFEKSGSFNAFKEDPSPFRKSLSIFALPSSSDKLLV